MVKSVRNSVWGPTVAEQDLAQTRRAAYLAARQVGAAHDDAEDVAQESILKALRDLASNRITRVDFERWATGIARKMVSTNRRGAARREFRQRAYESRRQHDAFEIDSAEYALGWQSICDLLHTLSPRRRECVQLMLEGLSTNEIAASLDIGAGTVRAHLGAAYESLAETISELSPVADEHL